MFVWQFLRDAHDHLSAPTILKHQWDLEDVWETGFQTHFPLLPIVYSSLPWHELPEATRLDLQQALDDDSQSLMRTLLGTAAEALASELNAPAPCTPCGASSSLKRTSRASQHTCVPLCVARLVLEYALDVPAIATQCESLSLTH